ncbi:MAG: 2Fe-2S iron-sulfur cluster-binding protein [Ornithinimicrobium sp.]
MNLLVSSPPRRRARFHSLRISHIEHLTDQAVAVTLAVPPPLREEFAFVPGQHLTLRAEIDGEDVRRSYSICSSRQEYAEIYRLRVASARVPGGAMSNWLNDHAAAGQDIEVMTPMGTFAAPVFDDSSSADSAPFDGAPAARHHVAVAAGSGITPVLSVIRTVLDEQPQAHVTLFFGNKRADSIMFLEDLMALKNEHPARFALYNVLSQERPDVELFAGRIDRQRMATFVEQLVPVAAVDEWYVCGPHPMVTGVQDVLTDAGADPAHVQHEIFHVEDASTGAPDLGMPVVQAVEGGDDLIATLSSGAPEAVITVTLDGRTTRVPMPSRAETILAATLRERPDAPYSCTGGICGTCRARVVDGEIRMDQNWALEPEEIAAGIVLACQSHPVTDEVRVDYDA